MRNCKFTKTYFGHSYFYYEPHSFTLPVSVIVDGIGMIICFGFLGLCWLWKKDKV